MKWLVDIYTNPSGVSLASHPGHMEGGKMAWYPLFAHARKSPWFYGVSYTIVNKLFTILSTLTSTRQSFSPFLTMTKLCRNDDKKAFNSSLSAFIHCSKTLWHVNDAILTVEVYWFLGTRQCRLLPSKQCLFWLQNHLIMCHREHEPACTVAFQQINQKWM